MTQSIESAGNRIVPTRGFFLDRLWIWITGLILWAVGTIATALALWIWTPFWQNVSTIWAAPQTLAVLQADVAELRGEVAEATGDDRVIRQPRGLSYVTEPVHVGEDVVFNLVVERTTLGAKCDFLGGQSLFTEAGGVMTPGSAIPATTRRLADQQTRLRLRLTPPANLAPGRIELYLTLDYDCDGKRVYDKTDTVIYSLLARG